MAEDLGFGNWCSVFWRGLQYRLMVKVLMLARQLGRIMPSSTLRSWGYLRVWTFTLLGHGNILQASRSCFSTNLGPLQLFNQFHPKPHTLNPKPHRFQGFRV